MFLQGNIATLALIEATRCFAHHQIYTWRMGHEAWDSAPRFLLNWLALVALQCLAVMLPAWWARARQQASMTTKRPCSEGSENSYSSAPGTPQSCAHGMDIGPEISCMAVPASSKGRIGVNPLASAGDVPEVDVGGDVAFTNTTVKNSLSADDLTASEQQDEAPARATAAVTAGYVSSGPGALAGPRAQEATPSAAAEAAVPAWPARRRVQLTARQHAEATDIVKRCRSRQYVSLNYAYMDQVRYTGNSAMHIPHEPYSIPCMQRARACALLAPLQCTDTKSGQGLEG